jgi:ADP-L-glycero-D-manno-heptose 6-epimerase
MERDGAFMMRNNYRYSARLLQHCLNEDVPFLYASSAAVYGNGTTFVESREHEDPLNVYAYSKYAFDQLVRRTLADTDAPVAGFRYFNVYGPHEAHKGRMASVMWHFFHQFRAEGTSSSSRAPAASRTASSGATSCRSTTSCASTSISSTIPSARASSTSAAGARRRTTRSRRRSSTRCARRRQAGALARRPRARGAIRYIPFPPALVGKYQNYTQADLAKLAASGYKAPTIPLDEGVRRYVEWLMARERA